MSNRDNIEITLITENDRERMEQVAQMEADVFPDPWSYHTAIAFYEKNKFGIDGERKFYYGGKNPEDAILMSRMV